MAKKPAIAIHIPKRLYKNDVGITIFVKGLYNSIRKSGTYRLLRFSPWQTTFTSVEQAKRFVEKHNIVFVMYHETRALIPRESYDRGLVYLEQCVPFLNSGAVHIADDKIKTKELLIEAGVPVLPHVTPKNYTDLCNETKIGESYVIKPYNAESGRGVKLIKRNDDGFEEYLDGSWQKIIARDTKLGLTLHPPFTVWSFVSTVVHGIGLTLGIFHLYTVLGALSCGIFGILFVRDIQKKLKRTYVYDIPMLEPFFADGMDEFYCLRCTVIGDTVVEAAKKAHSSNITPNISHGGVASATTLTSEQQAMAVAATCAVGANYAGIDLLYAHGKTVVCEVNVGPIGVYCEQTGVDVGELLGTYAMQKCDRFHKEKTS